MPRMPWTNAERYAALEEAAAVLTPLHPTTSLLLEHPEFRVTVCSPEAADMAMPSIAPLLRSKDGLQALLEVGTLVMPS